MISDSINFTLEELQHIMSSLNTISDPKCEVCSSARKKIETGIELLTIAEETKCQTSTKD